MYHTNHIYLPESLIALYDVSYGFTTYKELTTDAELASNGGRDFLYGSLLHETECYALVTVDTLTL